MEGELARVTRHQGGFFFRWQALDCGYSEREISALLRGGEWTRIRRGAYAERSLVDGLTTSGRHVLLARAVVAALDEPVSLSHYTALAVHGIPLWGVDLNVVHVLRGPNQSSRSEAGVVHHLGAIPEQQLTDLAGLRVTTLERSVVDACRITSFESGVVLADGALRCGPFDEELARSLVEGQRDWAGSVRASRVLRFADGLAQTVGESRTRVLMARIGVPRPRLQYAVTRADGTTIGFTDLYVTEYCTAVEFDGRVKYGRALYEKTGSLEEVDVGDVVWAEKVREDGIRDEGNEMVRIIWLELSGHDALVAQRFRRAFDRYRRRAG